MSVLQAHSRIGTLWRQRVDTIREYEVVRDGNVFLTGFSNSFVFSSEYDQARRLLNELLDQYHGHPVETVFHGKEISNNGGSCLLIEERHPLNPPQFDIDCFKNEICRDITLVRGIGPATKKRLNERGFYQLTDLLGHPKFRAGAHHVLDCLDRENSLEMMDLIGCRHTRSHPAVLGTAGFHKSGDFVFFDIETLGLFSRPIILFGIGIIERGDLNVRQYLVRDIAEEQAALEATSDLLAGRNAALVTFNGKSFDLPYLSDRLAYYGMDPLQQIPHFDVLHFSRRRWKDQFPSLRLTALEREVLGVRRDGDIPGQMVPEFFETYLRTGNCGPLVPVISHNRQDVVSLARLFFHLLGESYGCC
ncbi:MAG: ribonuclease H-like domain-containing protein [Methanoregula sp.]